MQCTSFNVFSMFLANLFSIADPTVCNSLPDELRDRRVVLTVLDSLLRQFYLVSINVTSAR